MVDRWKFKGEKLHAGVIQIDTGYVCHAGHKGNSVTLSKSAFCRVFS